MCGLGRDLARSLRSLRLLLLKIRPYRTFAASFLRGIQHRRAIHPVRQSGRPRHGLKTLQKLTKETKEDLFLTRQGRNSVRFPSSLSSLPCVQCLPYAPWRLGCSIKGEKNPACLPKPRRRQVNPVNNLCAVCLLLVLRCLRCLLLDPPSFCLNSEGAKAPRPRGESERVREWVSGKGGRRLMLSPHILVPIFLADSGRRRPVARGSSGKRIATDERKAILYRRQRR